MNMQNESAGRAIVNAGHTLWCPPAGTCGEHGKIPVTQSIQVGILQFIFCSITSVLAHDDDVSAGALLRLPMDKVLRC